MIWLWTNSPSSPHTALCYTLTALPLLWFFCFWILQDLPHLDNSSSLFPWWTSLVAQMVKRLPIMWRTCVQSLGRKEPLAKKMATHSSTLAWKIPWMEERGRPQSKGLQRVRHDWATSVSLSLPMIFIQGSLFLWIFADYHLLPEAFPLDRSIYISTLPGIPWWSSG